ncbi:RNA-guided endonuclease InsQ/TnpB family protein [Streptomyces sp. NPDC087272]|uniref:RNA-guided endonuclease InsQ/TnpB family protein n=1 Tax=Streptomyces sp. NPDC087272 TaxID=3365775 RepID=UPI00382C0D19
MPTTEVLRAYRFTLDPTDAQRSDLARHAGACRWAYNYALAKKRQSHEAWAAMRDAHVAAGMTEAGAKNAIKQAGAGLRDRIAVWDHHRKSLMAAARGTAAPEQPAAADRESGLAGQLRGLRDAATPETAKTLLAEARRTVNALKAEAFAAGFRTPSSMDTCALWRTERDLPREEGGSPWHSEVSVYGFTGGFDRADVAWKNWLDSFSGKRAGRRVGYPRFAAKHRSRDSFTLYHDVKVPAIRPDGYRRLTLPSLGSVRIHNSNKHLSRLLDRGQAMVRSVTISRGAHRWYASVLVAVQQHIPDKPTRRQRTGGLVGIDLGSRHLAALSSRLDQSDPDSTLIEHPRFLNRDLEKIQHRQRALSRTKKGSSRRKKAADHLARAHHEVVMRRTTYLHKVTKRLTTRFAQIAIEDLDLTGMTASARGTEEQPGTNVKVQAQFNRHLLDAGLGELRRQLTYKSPWYGAQLIVLDRAEPVASTCAKCGERDPSSTPSRARFTCPSCGNAVPRHENAVANIIRTARRQTAVASDRGETQNARRVPIPGARKSARAETLTREDTG